MYLNLVYALLLTSRFNEFNEGHMREAVRSRVSVCFTNHVDKNSKLAKLFNNGFLSFENIIPVPLATKREFDELERTFQRDGHLDAEKKRITYHELFQKKNELDVL